MFVEHNSSGFAGLIGSMAVQQLLYCNRHDVYLLVALLHYLLHDLDRGIELGTQNLGRYPAKHAC